MPVLLLALLLVPADTLQGKVVRVADGDTITVLDSVNVQHKIRLYGIDAPEKTQPFGARAKESLAINVHEKQASIETHGTDRFGRTIGTVFVDGKNINLKMAQGGWAWWYRRYAANDLELRTAETAARVERRGLWADKEPVAPWEWRRTEKKQGKK